MTRLAGVHPWPGTQAFKIRSHTFSMSFRSGERDGQGKSSVWLVFSSNHLLTTLAVWMGLLSQHWETKVIMVPWRCGFEWLTRIPSTLSLSRIGEFKTKKNYQIAEGWARQMCVEESLQHKLPFHITTNILHAWLNETSFTFITPSLVYYLIRRSPRYNLLLPLPHQAITRHSPPSARTSSLLFRPFLRDSHYANDLPCRKESVQGMGMRVDRWLFLTATVHIQTLYLSIWYKTEYLYIKH